jgi:hypothetical protein
MEINGDSAFCRMHQVYVFALVGSPANDALRGGQSLGPRRTCDMPTLSTVCPWINPGGPSDEEVHMPDKHDQSNVECMFAVKEGSQATYRVGIMSADLHDLHPASPVRVGHGFIHRTFLTISCHH